MNLIKKDSLMVSRQSLEILLDLIEIKVSSLQIQDRDDAKELNKLRKCRQELLSETNKVGAEATERPVNPKKLYKNPSSLRR
jgi:chaperonin cofactor prefoldin